MLLSGGWKPCLEAGDLVGESESIKKLSSESVLTATRKRDIPRFSSPCRKSRGSRRSTWFRHFCSAGWPRSAKNLVGCLHRTHRGGGGSDCNVVVSTTKGSGRHEATKSDPISVFFPLSLYLCSLHFVYTSTVKDLSNTRDLVDLFGESWVQTDTIVSQSPCDPSLGARVF